MPVPAGLDLKRKESDKHVMVSSQQPGAIEYKDAGMECKSVYKECNHGRICRNKEVADMARPMNCSICFLEALVWESKSCINPSKRIRFSSGNVSIPVATLMYQPILLTSEESSQFFSNSSVYGLPGKTTKAVMLLKALRDCPP